ncbi:MAG: sugar phosphate nucleotidyltransferase [Bdellovibrionota bacterium]
MHNINTVAIVLAAGQGKRMNSTLPKVAHLLAEKPLIIWAIESLMAAKIKNFIPVISPTQNLVKEIITSKKFSSNMNLQFAYQNEQLGTAHAVFCGAKLVMDLYKNQIPSNLMVIVSYGDTPMVKAETFKKLMDLHLKQNNSFTVLAFKAEDPFGYGRIITNANGELIAIREQKDCSKEEENIQICNSGILCANYSNLTAILPLIKNNNLAKEFYLTDIPIFALEQRLKIGLMVEDEEAQFLGVNTQEQLQELENRLILEKL